MSSISPTLNHFSSPWSDDRAGSPDTWKPSPGSSRNSSVTSLPASVKSRSNAAAETASQGPIDSLGLSVLVGCALRTPIDNVGVNQRHGLLTTQEKAQKQVDHIANNPKADSEALNTAMEIIRDFKVKPPLSKLTAGSLKLHEKFLSSASLRLRHAVPEEAKPLLDLIFDPAQAASDKMNRLMFLEGALESASGTKKLPAGVTELFAQAGADVMQSVQAVAEKKEQSFISVNKRDVLQSQAARARQAAANLVKNTARGADDMTRVADSARQQMLNTGFLGWGSGAR